MVWNTSGSGYMIEIRSGATEGNYDYLMAILSYLNAMTRPNEITLVWAENQYPD